jgi:hypothetical protein
MASFTVNERGSLVGEKVVVRYLDGSLVKGYTYDFSPRGRVFHVFPDQRATPDPRRIYMADLKAIFSVKTFEGDPRYRERKEFVLRSAGGWRRVEVAFQDGEILVGTVRYVSAENLGFFLTPADPTSNNLRVFIVGTAVARLRPLTEPQPHLEVRTARTGRPVAPRGNGVRLPRRLLNWLLSTTASGSPR